MNDTGTPDDKDHELDKIRMKKMQELMDAKKRQEDMQNFQKSVGDKVDFVLRSVLAQDAYQYLQRLKQNEPNVYQYIMNQLVGQDVIQKIDLLIMLIQRQGGVARRIPVEVIIRLERRAKGTKSKIKVKRGDDVMDLGSYLKKD
jgi:DNA-binding TFAR19-related protein (PDSD5 family)